MGDAMSGEEELKRRMLKEAEEAIEELLKKREMPEEITLSEIEELVGEAGEQVKAGITRVLVAESEDRQDVILKCEKCGRRMDYKGQKSKRVVTETGEVTVKRAYYYCPHCRVGIFPPG
jgi:hypothetical protein